MTEKKDNWPVATFARHPNISKGPGLAGRDSRGRQVLEPVRDPEEYQQLPNHWPVETYFPEEALLSDEAVEAARERFWEAKSAIDEEGNMRLALQAALTAIKEQS